MVLVLAPREGGAGKKEEINKNGDIIYSGMHPILMVRIHTGVTREGIKVIQGIISLVRGGPGGRPEGWRNLCMVTEEDVRAAL